MLETANPIWSAIESGDVDEVYALIKENDVSDYIALPLDALGRMFKGHSNVPCDQPDGPYNYTNFRPLMSASFHGHDDIVQMLIEHGADVNAVTDNNMTALHIAVEARQVQVVHTLLSKGAKPSAAMTCGTTPLHLTVLDGGVTTDVTLEHHIMELMECEIACNLVLKLADQNARDKWHETALEKAMRLENWTMMDLLSSLHTSTKAIIRATIEHVRFTWTGYLIQMSKDNPEYEFDETNAHMLDVMVHGHDSADG